MFDNESQITIQCQHILTLYFSKMKKNNVRVRDKYRLHASVSRPKCRRCAE